MKYKKDLEGLVMNIGDHFYTIHFHKDLERRFDRLGQADPLRGLIWLDEDGRERATLTTLVHEIFETMVCSNGIQLDHKWITVLENEIFSFCMKNPKVLAVLIKEAIEKSGSEGKDPEELANMEPDLLTTLKMVEGGSDEEDS